MIFFLLLIFVLLDAHEQPLQDYLLFVRKIINVLDSRRDSHYVLLRFFRQPSSVRIQKTQCRIAI